MSPSFCMEKQLSMAKSNLYTHSRVGVATCYSLLLMFVCCCCVLCFAFCLFFAVCFLYFLLDFLFILFWFLFFYFSFVFFAYQFKHCRERGGEREAGNQERIVRPLVPWWRPLSHGGFGGVGGEVQSKEARLRSGQHLSHGMHSQHHHHHQHQHHHHHHLNY